MTEDAHTKSDSYRVRHTVPDQAPRTKVATMVLLQFMLGFLVATTHGRRS